MSKTMKNLFLDVKRTLKRCKLCFIVNAQILRNRISNIEDECSQFRKYVIDGKTKWCSFFSLYSKSVKSYFFKGLIISLHKPRCFSTWIMLPIYISWHKNLRDVHNDSPQRAFCRRIHSTGYWTLECFGEFFGVGKCTKHPKIL